MVFGGRNRNLNYSGPEKMSHFRLLPGSSDLFPRLEPDRNLRKNPKTCASQRPRLALAFYGLFGIFLLFY